ncbi:MAG: dihydrolipoamide acetyltransferase family protein [Candidatus Humimicrobiaceae bacterium]
MFEVLMPKMGETMETGTIEKWRKKEGDKVEKGDILYDLATDKVSLEVESFNSGILKKIVKAEGEEVPIMEVIAYIGEKDEEVPELSGPAKKDLAAQSQETKQTMEETVFEADLNKTENNSPNTETGFERISISPIAKNLALSNNIDISKVKGTGPSGRIVKEDIEDLISLKSEDKRIFISPFAKKIARESSVDFKAAGIKGSGPNGRIVKKDIDDYLKTAKEFEKKDEIITETEGLINTLSVTPLRGIRKIIAQRMVESKQNIPHILLYAVCDVTNIISLRSRLKDKIEKTHGVKLTYTDFLVKITAEALNEFKGVNSSLQNNSHIVYSDINIGIAVSANDSLIVPTIYNADKLGVIEIARKRTELVEKGRTGKLSLEEISNATFTISNLGMYGVRSFTAIINPPQGAIMMVSEMYEAPVVVNGKIEASILMEIGVAVDHRIIDGALGARFLQSVKGLVEAPEMTLL